MNSIRDRLKCEPQRSLFAQKLSEAKEIAGVTRISNITFLDDVGLPVWSAIRPLSLSLAVSQGKGDTDYDAVISALMESLEGFHAENPIFSHTHARSLRSTVNSDAYLNIFGLPISSSAPIGFDLNLDWTIGRDLISGNDIFVPYEFIDLSFFPKWTHQEIFRRNSIGLAGGATMKDAILHALSEVIENDQTSLWIAGMSHPIFGNERRVNLASISERKSSLLIQKIFNSGLELSVWFTSCEMQMPAFACILHDNRLGALFPQRASGYGAHPYKEVALYRALCEAIQSRLTFISGSRDDFFPSRYQSARSDTPHALTWKKAIAGSKATLSFCDIPQYSCVSDISKLIEYALNDIARVGCDRAIIVDLTRVDIGIPFIKIIVPHAEAGVLSEHYVPGKRMASFLSKAD